jgi:hypothetical protein
LRPQGTQYGLRLLDLLRRSSACQAPLRACGNGSTSGAHGRSSTRCAHISYPREHRKSGRFCVCVVSQPQLAKQTPCCVASKYFLGIRLDECDVLELLVQGDGHQGHMD